MVQTQPSRLTFHRYLTYDDGTDNRYELVGGQLVAMTPPTWQHVLIARFLERLFESAISELGTDGTALQGPGQQIDDMTLSRPPRR
ncbi:MAG: hypothetical protein HC922_03400 [Leptolyngbyaceae cyanobacterium SM2_3_12]|nr:hypothetical protein [Leptolyngbyaceae cyanobacterium SM2_3_12]